MRRPITTILCAAGLAAALALPSSATPRTTVERTIRDRDGDNLLEFAPGEDYTVRNADEDFRPPRNGSVLNFLQLSDFQMVDEESPGRVEFLDGTQRGPFTPFSAAYRPQESLTTQVTEAMVRAVRNTTSPVTGERLDLAVLTGDNADSQQFNETRWFIDILDGTAGPRDRSRLPDPSDYGEDFEAPQDFVLADKIDPNSGVPVPGCEATPGTVYDGVRGGGTNDAPDLGYYEPDSSGPQSDGDGYSPHRTQNQRETGRDVTVRDFPGLFEAAQQRFEAIGLDLPWYTAFGNHDALVQGNSPDAYFGPGGLFPPNTEVANPAYHSFVTGCLKPMIPPSALPDSQAELEQFVTDFFNDPAGYLEEHPGQAEVVPPDARRCFLSKDESIGGPSPCAGLGWIQQHFLTTGAPVGHGFAPAPCPPIGPAGPTRDDALCASYGRPPIADFYNDGYYSFSPRQGLRFIVLDTVTDECGTLFCSEGSVDDPQFRWLEHQIQTAAAAGQYVMVFSHHTLRTTRWPSTDASEFPIHWGQRIDRENYANPQNPMTLGETLEELFCRSPNLLAHIAGHEHENYVQHYRCAADVPPTAGTNDFWHVSTAAHIDWPQQARMIELIDNGAEETPEDGTGTMSLVLTMLDHGGPPNPGAYSPCEPGQQHAGPGCEETDYFARGQSGTQVLKLASIGRELAYNDYQGSRAALGSSPSDRNTIIVLDRPWPYPAAAGD